MPKKTAPSKTIRCTAALATARGAAAIATIELHGPDASSVLDSVFEAAANAPLPEEPGQVAVGWTIDGQRRLDQVVIGCEHAHCIAVHCHGSPLIVEQIMALLSRRGARLVSLETCLAEQLARDGLDQIGIEAALTQAAAVTPEGVHLIARQRTNGLGAWARDLLNNIDRINPDDLHHRSGKLLAKSRAAAWMIRPCLVTIVGAPNSGKSTLLNALAGRPLALVADHAGTTRDYVTATCRIKSLVLELIDTAGLEAQQVDLAEPDRIAREHTERLVNQADLVLWVADTTAQELAPSRPANLETPAILAWNKTDLEAAPAPKSQADAWAAVVALSALTGDGLDDLLQVIRHIVTASAAAPDEPIIFTDRQHRLVEQLAIAPDRKTARDLLIALIGHDNADHNRNQPPGRL